MASNPFDEFDEAENPFDEFDEKPIVPRTTGQEIGRQLGLTARVIPEAVGSLPMAALEFGAGVANLGNRALGREGNVSFQRQFERGLDRVFPKRETGLEKGVGIAGNVMVGSKLPAPVGGASAPKAFRTVDEVKRASTAARVRAAQEAGYVIPPVTTNPTTATKLLEGTAGKLSTAQLASARNQENTVRLAAKDLGLNEDAELTVGAIRSVIKEGGEAYEAVRGAGTVSTDAQFTAALDAAEAATKGANNSFKGLVKDSPLGDRIAALRVNQFDASDAVDAIRVLRDYADEAGAQGSKHAAGAYRKVATALEDALDRHLVKAGNPEAIRQFRSARTMIAKAYTVLKGFNESTGQVNATKLAGELAKNKPIIGGLRTIAQTAQSFPKATRQFNESLPGVTPLDLYASVGGAAMSGNAGLLAVPFIRQGARNALLSPFGQKLAVPSQGGPVRPEYANALARAIAAGQLGLGQQ